MGYFYRLYRVLILIKNPHNFILILNALYALIIKIPSKFFILSHFYYSHYIIT